MIFKDLVTPKTLSIESGLIFCLKLKHLKYDVYMQQKLFDKTSEAFLISKNYINKKVFIYVQSCSIPIKISNKF